MSLGWQDELTDSPYSFVSRFAVNDDSDYPSIVVKQYRVLTDQAGTPSDPSGPLSRLYDEYAALRFIEETDRSGRIGPRAIALDPDQCVLVQEDLGEDENQALRGDDPDEAENYLLDYVRTLGRLHGITSGREEAYERLREGMGPTRHSLLAGVEVEKPVEIEPMLLRWWSAISGALGVENRESCELDLSDVAEFVRRPGAYNCLTHGDVCNGNELRVDGKVVLIDFENAAFRHALLDSAADPSIFQSCYRGDLIPTDVQLRMRDVYRAELVKGCPDASDDASFYGAIARACVFRSLYQLKRMVKPGILDRNEPFGSTTKWQRILKALDAIVWVTNTYVTLPAIGNAADYARAQLLGKWPEEYHASPLFPAFDSR